MARIELLDAAQVRACNLHSKLGLPEQPHLFVEFHGTPKGVAEQADLFGALADGEGGGDFTWATRPEDRTRLWQARHDAFWAGFTLRPGAKSVPTDVCVPISRLADCVGETRTDMDANGLVGPMVGHVGDGNFHVQLLIDDADAAEVARAEAFMERLALRAIAMDGTCTGEHGVGQRKAKYLKVEHAAGALDAMRAIKAALDPLNIMNPGKILP